MTLDTTGISAASPASATVSVPPVVVPAPPVMSATHAPEWPLSVGERAGITPAALARIMIVDDELANIDLLRQYLSAAGYKQFHSTDDGSQAIGLIQAQRPDIVLIDLMMPGVSGLDILAAMRSDPALCHVPAIVLTATGDPRAKLKALELGAIDFLSKPVEPSELVLRLRNALAVKAYHDQLAQYSARLEQQVRARTAELEASRQEAILCLARAAEYRDDDTGRHVIRVGRYAAIIAKQLGFNDRIVHLLEQAAQLHDVGKIGIPDAILCKPGKLDPIEYRLMKNHCPIGRKIIQPMTDDEWKSLRQHTELGAAILGIPSSPVMRLAAVIAQTHHEKWDGTGYPLGLAGEKIPLEGRITAVADVFDALSSKRPYKPAFPRDRCFAILQEGRGSHFDPRILDAFFLSEREIVEVQEKFADEARHAASGAKG